MSLAYNGDSVNGSGTLIATAKRMDGGVVDTTNASLDSLTLVTRGTVVVPISKAINMGWLARSGTVLTEQNPAQTPSRLG